MIEIYRLEKTPNLTLILPDIFTISSFGNNFITNVDLFNEPYSFIWYLTDVAEYMASYLEVDEQFDSHIQIGELIVE